MKHIKIYFTFYVHLNVNISTERKQYEYPESTPSRQAETEKPG